jgi:hypothetical protein
MSDACSGGSATRRTAGALRAADALALAASPTFAIMALLTSLPGGGPTETVCSATPASPLSSMVTMYLLMSAFHAGSWLKLIRASGRSVVLKGRNRQRDDQVPRRAAGFRD